MLQRLPNGTIAISVCSIVVSFRVPASECSVLRNAVRTTASERSVLCGFPNGVPSTRDLGGVL